jgi:hypothetical protein
MWRLNRPMLSNRVGQGIRSVASCVAAAWSDLRSAPESGWNLPIRQRPRASARESSCADFGVAALPTRRQKFPKKRRGDAARSTRRIGNGTAPSLAIRRPQAFAWSTSSNMRPSSTALRRLGPLRMRSFAESSRARLATLCSCRRPRIRGPGGELLGACQFHGAKGVGPWNAKGNPESVAYGKLAWEKRRRRQDGAYRNQDKFENVRVKKEDRLPERDRMLELIKRQHEQPRVCRDRYLTIFTRRSGENSPRCMKPSAVLGSARSPKWGACSAGRLHEPLPSPALRRSLTAQRDGGC